MTAQPCAIRADGLTKYYRSVIGVEDLSFEVRRGEIFGFLGANGAGKTTAMRLLLDLLRPDRGSAAVLGVNCHTASLQARRLIGYLPGELPVYPDLSGGGYVDYLAQLEERPVPAAYLRELFDRFDVSDVDLRRRLREQSHGMKRKLGIIQALMGRAPVIILDEPTAGLDPLIVHAFREMLLELRRRGDTTVLLSSHVLTEVETMCDRVGVIRAGRMIAVETVENLARQSGRRVTFQFGAPVPAGGPLPAGTTIVSQTPREWILEVRGPVGPLIASLAGFPVHDMRIDAFKLEDVVVAFYQGE
jgi:ABC-2 type transport system ATP-binding protein